MQFKRTVMSCLALVAVANTNGLALAAVDPAAQAAKGLEISAPLKLDAQRLMAMRAGEKVSIDFPVIGRKTVVFEATTKGLDGIRYWHGSLEGQPSDRVFLKQGKDGFVGAIRFGGRQVAFKQQPDRTLAAVSTVGPVAGQAYSVGTATDKGIYNIAGNFAALTQAEVGAEIALPLPNGQVEVAIVTSSHLDADGFVQVQGVSRMDGAAAPSVVTIGKDAVFGTVITNGSEYQIITRQGQTQIVDPKAAGWAQVRGVDEAPVPSTNASADASTAAGNSEPLSQAATVSGVSVSAAAATTSAATATVSLVPLAAGTINTNITLLMTYSQTYVNLWGTEAVARTRLSNIVQVANSAYANSGTGIAFRIVGWSLIRQPDTTPQVNLPAMRADSGYFKGLAALRASTGAAVSVFFAPFNSVTGSTGTCGLAYVPGAGAAGLASYNSQIATQNLLFAALNDGQSANGYCETLSLAHELGHNLGNAHDKANSSFPGAFSYSYGKGVLGSFGTVMSYISPRVALFSSPQLSCTVAKAPCGTATENVVATMLQTKVAVAARGVATKASVSSDGFNIVSGWLTNSNGTPYTGAATVKPTLATITCATGTTGLYICKVPSAVTSVTLSVTATGKTVTPAVGSFTVNATANTPVNGTRFYLK
jgi:hypothetical protein